MRNGRAIKATLRSRRVASVWAIKNLNRKCCKCCDSCRLLPAKVWQLKLRLAPPPPPPRCGTTQRHLTSTPLRNQADRQAGSELAHLQQLSRAIGQVICTFDTFVHLFVQLMNLHRQHTHTYTERHPNYKK